jgi:hypothetical protein
MAKDQKIIKGKVGLLELAKQLGKCCAATRSRSADRASAALSLPQATKRGNLASQSRTVRIPLLRLAR